MIIIERSRRIKRRLRIEETKLVFQKKLRGEVHVFELPLEIAEWAKKNLDILDWLVFDSPIASSLRRAEAVRNLIVLLYMKAHGIAICRSRELYGIDKSCLYRLEKLLHRHGLDKLYSVLTRRGIDRDRGRAHGETIERESEQREAVHNYMFE